MKLIEVLQKMKVSDLKREISKQNIKGYSKLKKAEIIKIMIDRPDKFKYLLLDNMKQKKELLQDKIKLKEAKDKLKKLTAKKIPAKKAQKAEVIKPKPKREPMIPKIIKTKTGIITVKPKEEPKPTQKKSLSPLEDIKNYLNDTNNENYKNFINNKDKKERLTAMKKWLKVLKIKKDNLLDSDIPYNVNNLFNENKLNEYQIFKDITKRQKGLQSLSEIQKVLDPQRKGMTEAYTLKDEQKDKNKEINIKLNLKSEGLKSLLQTVRINKLYEVFCQYYSDKQFKGPTKQTKEEIQQLNKELKKELKTYKSGLYFTGVGCGGAPPVPKALKKLYEEKLNDSTNRKFGGQLYMLVSNINQYFDNYLSKLKEPKKEPKKEEPKKEKELIKLLNSEYNTSSNIKTKQEILLNNINLAIRSNIDRNKIISTVFASMYDDLKDLTEDNRNKFLKAFRPLIEKINSTVIKFGFYEEGILPKLGEKAIPRERIPFNTFIYDNRKLNLDSVEKIKDKNPTYEEMSKILNQTSIKFQIGTPRPKDIRRDISEEIQRQKDKFDNEKFKITIDASKKIKDTKKLIKVLEIVNNVKYNPNSKNNINNLIEIYNKAKKEELKEEPKKETPKPAPKKETKELTKDEKQLQQLFINDARLKNKFKATKSPMISGLSPKEREIRTKIRIGIEKEIKENKFLLFELEEKMKLKKEDDNIKAEKAKLKLFKLNVENFLKNPSEKLLEFIDINIELMDELPESKQDKLDKAIDKFENKKK